MLQIMLLQSILFDIPDPGRFSSPMERLLQRSSNLTVSISDRAIHDAAFGLSELQIPDEISNAHTKGIRNRFQGVNRYIGFAPLDFSDVSAVKSRAISENVLGPAAFHAQCSDRCSDFFLNLLHSSQFGGTLVKTIQVITCIARDVSRRCVRSRPLTISF